MFSFQILSGKVEWVMDVHGLAHLLVAMMNPVVNFQEFTWYEELSGWIVKYEDSAKILGEVDPSLMGWVVLSPRFWTPGSFSVKMVHMTFYPNYLLCMDSWKKTTWCEQWHLHFPQHCKLINKMDCTTVPQELSNSTVCRYHSIHLVPQILKTKWFVHQMDLAGKPWFTAGWWKPSSREGQKLRRRWLNGDSNVSLISLWKGCNSTWNSRLKKKHDQLLL